MVARRRQRSAPARHCILCGQSAPRAAMIRLVLAPDGSLVPDLKERLPGRGAWIHADRTALAATLQRRRLEGALARALRTPVSVAQVPRDIVDRLERLLRAQVLGQLGLACRAGRLVTGFEKVRERLEKGRVMVLIEASDAAPDGRYKLASRAAPTLHVLDLFDRAQLSLALGRENVVHAAIERGGATPGLMRELRRLAAWHGRPWADGRVDNRGANESNKDPAQSGRPVSHNEEQI